MVERADRSSYIRPFGTIGIGDVALVGGKNASSAKSLRVAAICSFRNSIRVYSDTAASSPIWVRRPRHFDCRSLARTHSDADAAISDFKEKEAPQPLCAHSLPAGERRGGRTPRSDFVRASPKRLS